VLAGTQKNRVNGYPGKILNPFPDAILKVFPGNDAAPGNGVSVLLEFSQEKD
jgi:hypothetical protein